MTRKQGLDLINDLRAQLEQHGELTLTITYGTSKGRDTYGYRTVTVRSFAGTKIAGIAGGGFDLTNSVKADTLATLFQKELQTALHSVSLEGASSGGHPYYCFYRDDETGTIFINGAAGWTVVDKALALLNISDKTVDAGKNKNVWILRKN